MAQLREAQDSPYVPWAYVCCAWAHTAAELLVWSPRKPACTAPRGPAATGNCGVNACRYGSRHALKTAPPRARLRAEAGPQRLRVALQLRMRRRGQAERGREVLDGQQQHVLAADRALVQRHIALLAWRAPGQGQGVQGALRPGWGHECTWAWRRPPPISPPCFCSLVGNALLPSTCVMRNPASTLDAPPRAHAGAGRAAPPPTCRR